MLPYAVTADRLQMRLLNCDLKKLETAAQGVGQKKNDQGIECVFVFTLRNSKSWTMFNVVSIEVDKRSWLVD